MNHAPISFQCWGNAMVGSPQLQHTQTHLLRNIPGSQKSKERVLFFRRDFFHLKLIHLEEYSVTELECRHALGVSPERRSNALRCSFFYLRSREFAEKAGPDYLSGSTEETTKMEQLRRWVSEENPEHIRHYSAPSDIGELVLSDLKKLIDDLYPAGSEPSELQKERVHHRVFAEARSAVYISRPEVLKTLRDHTVSHTQHPLIVTGPSGSGKSALMANWSFLLQRSAENTNGSVCVISYFCGSSPASTEAVNVVRHILLELNDFFLLEKEIPSSKSDILSALSDWLMVVAPRGVVVLCIDAVNQLEENSTSLDWIPLVFPPSVRVFISTLPDHSTFHTLSARNWPIFQVSELSDAERDQLVVSYLRQYGKVLDQKQRESVYSCQSTYNPLFLRIFLDEIRLASFETLGERIRTYVSCVGIEAIYERVLERLENDYGGIVSDSFSFIWAARRGMLEEELVSILGVSPQKWSFFYFSVKDALISPAGCLSFFHNGLRLAVQARYLSTPEKKKAVHEKLSSFFQLPKNFSVKTILSARQIEELPYQLQQAEKHQELVETLCVPCVFSQLCLSEWFLLQYFTDALSKTSFPEPPSSSSAEPQSLKLSDKISLVLSGAVEKHRQNLDFSDSQAVSIFAEYLIQVSRFLREYGSRENLPKAIKICTMAVEMDRRVSGKKSLRYANDLYDLGWLYFRQRDLKEAQKHYSDALSIYQSISGPFSAEVGACLNHMGWVSHWSSGRPAALAYCLRALAIRQDSLPMMHKDLAQSLHTLGFFQSENQRERDRALRILVFAYVVAETSLGVTNKLTTNIKRDLERFGRGAQASQTKIQQQQQQLQNTSSSSFFTEPRLEKYQKTFSLDRLSQIDYGLTTAVTENFKQANVVVLYGPPSCGCSQTVRQYASANSLRIVRLMLRDRVYEGPDIEKWLGNVFDADLAEPSLIYIDSIAHFSVADFEMMVRLAKKASVICHCPTKAAFSRLRETQSEATRWIFAPPLSEDLRRLLFPLMLPDKRLGDPTVAELLLKSGDYSLKDMAIFCRAIQSRVFERNLTPKRVRQFFAPPATHAREEWAF
eukprot:TRINITY_DN674_c1_g1_i2.p1 TRINITY_DN674_c1_g1~~TRINITY_DN674_c1_g1_i2.p1  ORF type:complete len:1068 (-),score=232.72 TRINITY_DN674_c1_g1_i2:17-3220(-)